jgi:hypothetical protein
MVCEGNMEDQVVWGHTIHVENVCVEPSLLALYRAWNDPGRGEPPALFGGQSLGRARGDEIRVAIRDTGRFMDPRSRGDWWQGKKTLSLPELVRFFARFPDYVI